MQGFTVSAITDVENKNAVEVSIAPTSGNMTKNVKYNGPWHIGQGAWLKSTCT